MLKLNVYLAVQSAFPITVAITCVVGALVFVGMSRCSHLCHARPVPTIDLTSPNRLLAVLLDGMLTVPEWGMLRAAFVWYARWKRLLFIPDAAALTREPPSHS